MSLNKHRDIYSDAGNHVFACVFVYGVARQLIFAVTVSRLQHFVPGHFAHNYEARLGTTT